MSSSITCPPETHDINRGLAFVATDWPLAGISTLFVVLRVYSRGFLTRSFGSDDVAIVIAVGLTIAGTVTDTLADRAGYGRHCHFLSTEQLRQSIKWIYMSWMISFISYYFVRASVMLFTLRLLPDTKTRSQWIVYSAFALNIAITLVATISFGIQCRPFSALWHPTPDAKCVSSTVLTASNQTNGILACIIDIITACIPAFLLWKVQMKRRTKITLDIIFGLGVVTAALSIGRAATITSETVSNDVTWRMIDPLWFSLMESKIGVCLACCPALRQMVAYRARTKTILPSRNRQPPNEDFNRMHFRIHWRDWVWRGKRDPARAQGLLKTGTTRLKSSESGERFGLDDSQGSPLTDLHQQAMHSASQV